MSENPKYEKYSKALHFKRQIIFYGPPGTGKTYHASEFAKSLTDDNKYEIHSMPINASKEGWGEFLKQQFKTLIPKKCSIEEACDANKELKGERICKWSGFLLKCNNSERRISAHYGNEGKSDKNVVSFEYYEKARKVWLDVAPEKDRFVLIVNHSSSAYVCLPFSILVKKGDSGRVRSSWLEILIEKDKAVLNPSKDNEYDCTEFLSNLNCILGPPPDIRFVTFHPSYSYEEFIEGIKATVKENSIMYDIEDGIFKEFCEYAERWPNNKFVLIIDEINRGNISKILGELITNLENNKRGKHKTILAYSKTEFTVPENIFIIGTMNTADRSLAQLDVALRRRFAFLELTPNYDVLVKKIDGIEIGKLLKALNEKLKKEGLKNKQFGHSYFMKDAKPISKLEDLKLVFENDIIPMLQDYFYEDANDKICDILGKKFFHDKEIKSFGEDSEFKDAVEAITECKNDETNS